MPSYNEFLRNQESGKRPDTMRGPAWSDMVHDRNDQRKAGTTTNAAWRQGLQSNNAQLLAPNSRITEYVKNKGWDAPPVATAPVVAPPVAAPQSVATLPVSSPMASPYAQAFNPAFQPKPVATVASPQVASSPPPKTTVVAPPSAQPTAQSSWQANSLTSATGKAILNYAHQFSVLDSSGRPDLRYMWGGKVDQGSSPFDYGGWDCSGLTKWFAQKYGMPNLPGYAAGQYQYGLDRGLVHTSINQLRPGDLIFFNTGFMGGTKTGVGAQAAVVGHVGIYLGNDQFLHSSSGTNGTATTRLSTYITPTRKFWGGMRMPWSE